MLRRAKKLEIKCTKNLQNRFSSRLSRKLEVKWSTRIRCPKRRASRSIRSTKSRRWRTFRTANRRQSSYKSHCSSITFSISRRMIWQQATAHPSWMSRKFSSRQKLNHSIKMQLQIRFKIRTKVKSYNKLQLIMDLRNHLIPSLAIKIPRVKKILSKTLIRSTTRVSWTRWCIFIYLSSTSKDILIFLRSNCQNHGEALKSCCLSSTLTKLWYTRWTSVILQTWEASIESRSPNLALTNLKIFG